jgi:putative transposase
MSTSEPDVQAIGVRRYQRHARAGDKQPVLRIAAVQAAAAEGLESAPPDGAGDRPHFERVRNRRTDFCHQTAHTLTTEHGLIVVEDLRVKPITASAKEQSNGQGGTSARRRA